MTKAQKHMGRVAALGCVVCRLQGELGIDAQVHHIREGRIARNDWLTIPLCPSHHVGPGPNVHMRKDELLRPLKMHSEFDLLAVVLELLE